MGALAKVTARVRDAVQANPVTAVDADGPHSCNLIRLTE